MVAGRRWNTRRLAELIAKQMADVVIPLGGSIVLTESQRQEASSFPQSFSGDPFEATSKFQTECTTQSRHLFGVTQQLLDTFRSTLWAADGAVVEILSSDVIARLAFQPVDAADPRAEVCPDSGTGRRGGHTRNALWNRLWM